MPQESCVKFQDQLRKQKMGLLVTREGLLCEKYRVKGGEPLFCTLISRYGSPVFFNIRDQTGGFLR